MHRIGVIGCRNIGIIVLREFLDERQRCVSE
jgi:hypothetical protein